MIKIGQKMDHRRCYGLRGVVVLKKGLVEKWYPTQTRISMC